MGRHCRCYPPTFPLFGMGNSVEAHAGKPEGRQVLEDCEKSRERNREAPCSPKASEEPFNIPTLELF